MDSGSLSGRDLSLEVWRLTLLACGRADEHLARLALETHIQNRDKTLRLFDDAQKTIDVLKPRFRCWGGRRWADCGLA